MIRFLAVLVSVSIFTAASAMATVTLPFSTSFDSSGCSEGLNLYNNASGCSGLSNGGNRNPVNCTYDSVVRATANNPIGTGRGVAHCVDPGKNYQGGTFTVNFPMQTEFWVRFYIKYQSGFSWSSMDEHKLLWMDGGPTGKCNIFSLSGDRMRFWNQLTSPYEVVYGSSGYGWDRLSDGNWHYLEVHLKYGTNGHEDAWFDGVKVVNQDLNTTNSYGGWSHIEFMTNAAYPGGTYEVDIDDIAISNTGYIGPLGGSVGTTVPILPAPVNGACGSSSGQSFSILTAGSPNLCSAGTVASFAGSGPWTWGCNGSNGGTSTSSNACSANYAPSTATLLFSEDFENTSFSSRGWYDGGTTAITTAEYQSGTHAAQFSFASGATSPSSPYAGAMRKLFTPTDSLYVSFYTKFATGWRGSQKLYHPHIIYLLSDLDGDYAGMANAYLDTYIEFISDIGSPYAIRPQLAIQDSMRVNYSLGTPPNNLSATTEKRSVGYCNTPLSAGATGDCFTGGSNLWWSAATWKNATASIPANAWHKVEVYFKMNTISGNIGQRDGIMQEWIDGVQVINHSDVLYRTNQDATKKFKQFVLAPYIGDGSPIAQTFYIDNLNVWNDIPPSSSIKSPTGLKVIKITP